MIIEGAFFKLPELLISSRTPGQQYESTLVSHLAMAVLLEFEARSVQQPMRRIHIERPYPTSSGICPPARADLFVDLDGLIPDEKIPDFARYGIKPCNWLEAKLFARIGTRAGGETKVSNAGSMAFDLLRLCLYLPESGSGEMHRNNRYFLSVFDRHPSEYLAFARQSSSAPKREWLEALLCPGEQSVAIAFHEEPKSFRSVCRSEGMLKPDPLFAHFRVVTIEFGPLFPGGRQSFYGYLSRIVSFDITTEGSRLYFEDMAQEAWGQAEVELQRALAERFLGPARGRDLKVGLEGSGG